MHTKHWKAIIQWHQYKKQKTKYKSVVYDYQFDLKFFPKDFVFQKLNLSLFIYF